LGQIIVIMIIIIKCALSVNGYSDLLAINTLLGKLCFETEHINLQLRNNRKITENVGFFTNRNRITEPILKLAEKITDNRNRL